MTSSWPTLSEWLISCCAIRTLTPRSEEDEDEEEGEGEKAAPPVAAEADGEEVEQVEGEPAPPAKKRKNEPTELVEYSPDELRAVDKEMLNAEITQLEGEFHLSFDLNVCADVRRRGDRQG